MAKQKINQYIANRIARENAAKRNMTEEQLNKELLKLYTQQARELREVLLDVLLKIQVDSTTGEGIHTNDLFRTVGYTEIIKELNQRLDALGAMQIDITSKRLVEMYEYSKRMIEQYTPQGALVQDFVVPSSIDARQVVLQSWCIDGKDLSTRVYENTNRAKKVIQRALYDGCAQGKNAFTIATEMSDKLEIPLKAAYTLSRTELSHAAVAGQVQKYKELGFTHAKYLGRDCCPECQAYDGKIYTLDEMANLIPHHPNCRCSFTLVTDGEVK